MIRRTINLSVALLLGLNTVSSQSDKPVVTDKDIDEFFGDPLIKGATD